MPASTSGAAYANVPEHQRGPQRSPYITIRRSTETPAGLTRRKVHAQWERKTCSAVQVGDTPANGKQSAQPHHSNLQMMYASTVGLLMLGLDEGAPTPPALICVVCIILARPTSDSFALPSLRSRQQHCQP